MEIESSTSKATSGQASSLSENYSSSGTIASSASIQRTSTIPSVGLAAAASAAGVQPKALVEKLPEPETLLPNISPFADPFAGFVGHCFLHFCQFVDMLARWTKPHPIPAEIAAQSLLNSPRHRALKSWGTCSLGMVCCTVAAACLIPLFSASSVKSFLPLAFLLIIVPVALCFGRAAGVLGTIAAALIFADFLFEPAGLAVSDPVAKSHLIWMLIIGVVISDLLVRVKLHHTSR